LEKISHPDAAIHGATKQANQIEKGLPPHSSEKKIVSSVVLSPNTFLNLVRGVISPSDCDQQLKSLI
jgi:hypothetical protein